MTPREIIGFHLSAAECALGEPQAIIDDLRKAGWAIVPVEATEEMIDVGFRDAHGAGCTILSDRGPGGSGGIYRAMVEAGRMK